MAKPSGKSAALRSSGPFWPDRIVGVLAGLGHFALLLIGLALASLGFPQISRDLQGDFAHAAPRYALLLALLALVAFLFWTSVRLFRGRRVGHVVTAILAGLGVLSGGAGTVQTGQFDPRTGCSLFLLIFCLARLGGWGPRPA